MLSVVYTNAVLPSKNDPCAPVSAVGSTDYYANNLTWQSVDCGGDCTTNGEEVTNGTDPFCDELDLAGDCDGLTYGEETTGVDDPSTTGNPNDNDSDGDGTIYSEDRHPKEPVATDDTITAFIGTTAVFNVLGNDDYLTNADVSNLGETTLTNTGGGSALGSITFNSETGDMSYNADLSEAGKTITVKYEVCNNESGVLVCTRAQVFIT